VSSLRIGLFIVSSSASLALAQGVSSAPAKNASEDVFLGVIAGIITSLLLFLATLFYANTIRPWIQSLLYAEVDLSGEWKQEELKVDDATYRYEVQLKQRGPQITGAATITKTGSGLNDYTHRFQIAGTVWAGFVSLALRSGSSSQLSMASALVKISDRGQRLVGHWVYRSANDTADTEPVHLYKVKS